MPEGNPNKQTIASAKYHEKIGLISKSYKLRKEIVDAFAKACEENGTSQKKQLEKMMLEYIEEMKRK